MCGSTRNVARVARPFPSTMKLSITKQERGKGLAGQTSVPYAQNTVLNVFLIHVHVHVQVCKRHDIIL